MKDELDMKDEQLVIIKEAFKEKKSDGIKVDNCIITLDGDIGSSHSKGKKQQNRSKIQPNINNESQVGV